jgi:uracil phosphoribosyltransferase
MSSPVIAPLPPPQPAHEANTNLAHLNPLPESVFTLKQTAQLEALYTIIRDKDTSRGDFLFYSDRIIRLLVEEGLNHLPVVKRSVETPTVSIFQRLDSQAGMGLQHGEVGCSAGCRMCGRSWNSIRR